MFLLPRRVEKPWGYEIWFAHTDLYVGKILHINQGASLSLQYHQEKDETLYCHQGVALLTYEKDGQLVEEILPPGHAFRVRPGTKHRLRGGEGGCDVLEASTSQVDDVVRLQDDYGRTQSG